MKMNQLQFCFSDASHGGALPYPLCRKTILHSLVIVIAAIGEGSKMLFLISSGIYSSLK